MDTLRGFEDDRTERADHDNHDQADLRVDDNAQMDIGTDERRMHVRAYNHWVSLLNGRAYPSIEDLDPENIADFGPHSVLLDFTGGIDNPAIQFLGSALRAECALDSSVTHINQVPSRSLLSRLTDHYLQIIANRAPIGFEAEFVGTRGHNTMYRGILMPFSSDDDTIDFIYGVINWKELVDEQTQAKLTAEVAESVRNATRTAVTAPAWASGPSADIGDDLDDALGDAPADHINDQHAAAFDHNGDQGTATPLADQLMLAQQTAAVARASDTRSRAALYRALGRAFDFAMATNNDPAGYTVLLAKAGIAEQARAPMTPIIKLVFGTDYDKTRITEFASVLAHARRCNVPTGALADFLDMAEGGIKGIVAAERALRRPAAKPDPIEAARATFAKHAPLATIDFATGLEAGEFVLLIARASDTGSTEIFGSIAATAPGAATLIGKAARNR
ncbi:hypothetical protein [Sphingomonas sp. 28-62-11]|uniref:PAS domain-containing protein n=1 Tax=Sphingomonas sp. 28-62-11 TaxID=1970432 RepID=UPI000BC7B05C|nr:MAG: hypothetical protein B7Y49_06870 [Sphingomonas sp. 28-62-11]